MEQEIKQKEIIKEQLLILSNRQNLSITGIKKIISLKPELIQLDTNYNGVIISGNNLELIKLDNTTTRAEISGNIAEIRYLSQKIKEPLFRKLFK